MQALASYLNKYPGRRFVIVGRGPTAFDFARLADVADPIIFINDAVQLEGHATASVETFFFAHDACQRVWLTPELKSTAVLPRMEPSGEPAHPHQKRLFVLETPEALSVPRLVIYDWGGRYWAQGRSLAEFTREEIACAGTLALGGGNNDKSLAGGTIHSAIHFAWLCGATEIAFIGCDGTGTDYEGRLENRSQGVNLGVHAAIRKAVDLMCGELGLDTEYVSAPSIASVIPRLMHFVWFGDEPPWLQEITGAFQEHNPRWEVRLWTGMPQELPVQLYDAARGAQQVCQWADILYCWLLHEFGGMVMDTDCVTLRSFDPLRRMVPAWTTAHHEAHSRLTNGVMGSVPGGAAFARCCRDIPAQHAAMGRDERQWGRCMYGPDMLTRLFTTRGNDDFKVLPWHYFYPWRFCERDTAHEFWRAPPERRAELLAEMSDRFMDGERPYAVHLWGIEGSSQRPAPQLEIRDMGKTKRPAKTLTPKQAAWRKLARAKKAYKAAAAVGLEEAQAALPAFNRAKRQWEKVK